MMHLRHVVSKHVTRITRRFPILRRISATTVILILTWLYVIHWGERTTYSSHVQNCDWSRWEDWPQAAVPHHLVFVADPQLVDPHTYPGRPWPLSSLTESYTDRYMARNFKLINQHLDPDSIVFLGDLFDGGREWATPVARQLYREQTDFLKEIGVIKTDEGEEGHQANKRQEPAQPDQEAHSDEAPLLTEDGSASQQVLPSKPELRPSGPNGPQETQVVKDLYKFTHGENGRWSKWGADQWDLEYARFGKIFFAPEQLYPNTQRMLLPDLQVETSHASVINGAPDVPRTHYATQGGKQRRIVTNLPGNHDIGFGGRVQLPVRSRFHSHFGETNNVMVIGNHTFVSVDAPSFSAYDQFIVEGITPAIERDTLTHIWKPVSEFVSGVRAPAQKAVTDALNQYYPGSHASKGFSHEVTNNLVGISEMQDPISEMPRLPVVLLSHVPFYRYQDADCGNLRERGRAIPIHGGYQYQNVLTPDLSTLLIRKLAMAKIGNIEYIFSGDDHDYCDLIHTYNIGSYSNEANKASADMSRVREITVKSFSWAMGVRRPGFQLLSLWNPVDENGHTLDSSHPTIQTQLCLLPDQLSIFLSYVFLFVLTIFVLLIRAVVISLRRTSDWDDEESMSGSRFQQKLVINLNGKANGYASPDQFNRMQKSKSEGRQRASSTSTSTGKGSSTNLSVQRNFNARTRSVSPAGYAMSNGRDGYDPSQATAPLVEKGGNYPQLRWDDPQDSDEESHLGEDLHDSQAKWRKKRKAASRARRALNEFVISMVLVGFPCFLYYWRLVRAG